MALLSKPSGNNGVRYFNPKWSEDAYLLTFSEGTITKKSNTQFTVYGKATIKGILDTESVIAFTVNTATYKAKTYVDGDLTEVDLEPTIPESDLGQKLKVSVGDKEKVSVTGIISIGLMGCETQLEITEAKRNGGSSGNYQKADFYESTTKVLQARHDFYLSKMNELASYLVLSIEIKDLTDICRLNDMVKSSPDNQKLVAAYSSIVKSFWNAEK